MSNGFVPVNGQVSTQPDSLPEASEPVASTSAFGAAQSARILDVLFHGFGAGAYHDFVLHTNTRQYRLHRLLLSPSPRLRPLLDAGGDVHVDLDEPGMSEEGLAICLRYFYSSDSLSYLSLDESASQTAESVQLFAGVLSSAVWLGGIEELAEAAFQKCLDSICTATILQWIAILAQPTQPLGPIYHSRLLSRVREDIVVGLPTASGAFGPASDAHALADLESLFVTLPWTWLKETVESARFPASERQRFSFAKSVIQRRKTLPEVKASGAEETVVLAFGGEGSNVCLTRKQRKGRPLYKVNA